MVKISHQLGEIRRRLRSLILEKDLKHKEHDSKYYDHSFEKSKQYHPSFEGNPELGFRLV